MRQAERARSLHSVRTPALLLGMLVPAVAWQGATSHPTALPLGPEPSACRACHQKIVATFVQTAHFLTSAEATSRTIKARFAEGHNLLRTGARGVYFSMEQRNGVFYETGVDTAHGTRRTERIDFVVGSGRRGQSYLYWRGGLLFELPVSYLTGIEQWINSPGYADGQIDFGRLVVARCLECHSTSFTVVVDRGAVRYSRDYVLGISCEKCHGDGRQHVRYHSSHPGETDGRYILNPGRFSRARKLDNCGLCHSGPREPLKPEFSYRPGESLDDFFLPPSDASRPVPDVHGNQVGLLKSSKCFRSSATMSCSTCHDVHRPQRDLTRLAGKCLGCHHVIKHKMAARIGARMITRCIDCHMPNEKSRAIQINTPTTQFSLNYRSHAIGIYPEVTAAILQSSEEK